MDDAMSFLFELAGTTPEADAAAKALEDSAKREAEAAAEAVKAEQASAQAETSQAGASDKQGNGAFAVCPRCISDHAALSVAVQSPKLV
jgi:hypothetical protein